VKTHWTVLILSKEDTGIKKFKLSPLVAVFAGCVILFLTVFSAFAGYKLYHLRADISRIASIKPIFNSIKVNQQVNYKVTRLQKCFGTTNQPF